VRIVLSKDRPAQLDLLLTSLERLTPTEQTWVIHTWSDDDFEHGYRLCELAHPHARFLAEGVRPGRWSFEQAVRGRLGVPSSASPPPDTVTFLCDDDVWYRTPPEYPPQLGEREEVLCFAWRLGQNCTVQYPTNLPQTPPLELAYSWLDAPGDFGYPGSLDGHVFRGADLYELLADSEFPNPTALECALNEACLVTMRERRPLMLRPQWSCIVGVPVNRTSAQSGVRFGTLYPQPAAELNANYLRGYRIAFDRLDFHRVSGAHWELPYVWKLAPTSVRRRMQAAAR
jgi:hypothetical protein